MDSGVKNLQEFLEETTFCDFHNQNIVNLAKKLTLNCLDQKDKAIVLFNWVRDNILYRVGNWQKTASETLSEREGTCTNNANLLVALLRAVGIPAGFGIVKVYGRRYWGPIALHKLSKFSGSKSTHTYSLVYLNGRWIKCDCSDDAELCKNTKNFNYTNRIVHWDGENDACLNLKKKHIIEEIYPLANIDSWMIKKPRHAKGVPLRVANLYIKFLREHKKKVSTTTDLEIQFMHWLRTNHFVIYFLFILVSKLRDIELRFKKDEKNS